MMKFLHKVFFISLVILFTGVINNAFSTHIIGGALTYEHLGGSTYRISLRLYRDCNGIIGENQAWVEIYRGDGSNPGLSFYLPKLDVVELDPPIDTCAFDPGICVEEQVYQSIVSLPPSATGYY